MSFPVQRRRWMLAGGATLGAIALAALWSARGSFSAPTSTPAAVPRSVHDTGVLTPREIATRTMAATVHIRALDALGQLRGDGTGFFVSNDGMLATSLHVVRGAHSLEVRTLYGRTFNSVFFLGADGRRDLALLKVDADSAEPLPLASGSDPDVGERVFVTGNPLGQTGTFTDGLVSARRATEGTTFIQISAPIAPGSSGGPVVNDRAEVLGVTTLRLQRGQNLNYAIPSRYLRSLISSAGKPITFARGELPPLLRPPLVVSDPFATQTSHGVQEEADVIVRQLRRSDSLLKAHRGYAEGETLRGTLAEGDTARNPLRFAAGREYVIAGYCDEHCGVLTLTLRSPPPQGRVIDADVEIDDTPKLRFVAPGPGSYDLAVVMSSCDSTVCRFGVRSYTIERARPAPR